MTMRSVEYPSLLYAVLDIVHTTTSVTIETKKLYSIYHWWRVVLGAWYNVYAKHESLVGAGMIGTMDRASSKISP